MRYLMFVITILISSSVLAQNVKGKIVSSEDRDPIEGVTIALVGQNKMTTSTKKGLFEINSLQKQVHLILSHASYKVLDTIFDASENSITFYLTPNANELKEVIIVSSSRTNSRIEDLPTKVEVLGSEEVHEENGIKPGNIASLLGDIAGIQIQQTNATTGNADMRIQGLQGKYTQILRDGMPLFGGYAGSFSILQIPPLDLQQIELVKGASSTLYGGGAIAGMLNLISKKPKLNKEETSLTLNMSSTSEKNINIFSSARNQQLGYTVFAGNTSQKAADLNKDGFSDFPNLNTVFVHPRLFFYGKHQSLLTLGYNLTVEDRKGGDISLLENGPSDAHPFFIQNKMLRNTFDASWEKQINTNNQITFKSNFSQFDRNMSTNIFGMQGNQKSWFSEITYVHKTTKHHLVTGLNFNGEVFIKKGLDSSSIPNSNFSTIGVFVQDDWKMASKWTLQSGIRLDHHNVYGDFLLPRFSLMYKINNQFTMRWGTGLGYKTLNIFNAEIDERAFKFYKGLEIGTISERSLGANYDINYKQRVNGWDLTVNQTFFLNNIKHPLVQANSDILTYAYNLTLPGYSYYPTFTFYNETKSLSSFGFETYVQAIKSPIELYAGYVYTDAKRNYNTVAPHLPLIAKHKFATVIAYELNEDFRVGLESSYTGAQYLDNGTKTNAYLLSALMVRYTISKCSFVLNCENLFNIKQTNYGSIVSGPIKDPVFAELWAPVEGRVLNLSMYLKF